MHKLRNTVSINVVHSPTEVLLQLPLIAKCLVLLARCCAHMLVCVCGGGGGGGGGGGRLASQFWISFSDLQKQYEALQSGSGHRGLQVCLENCFKQLNEE